MRITQQAGLQMQFRQGLPEVGASLNAERMYTVMGANGLRAPPGTGGEADCDSANSKGIPANTAATPNAVAVGKGRDM